MSATDGSLYAYFRSALRKLAQVQASKLSTNDNFAIGPNILLNIPVIRGPLLFFPALDQGKWIYTFLSSAFHLQI